MEYFCCVLRRHLIKKVKDVNANTLFNSFSWLAANLFLRIHSYLCTETMKTIMKTQTFEYAIQSGLI